jgi:hypothetical protein
VPDVRLHRVLVNSGDLASNNQTQDPPQRCWQTEGAAQAEGTGGLHQRRCAVSSPSGETCTTRRAPSDLPEPEDDLGNLQIRRAPWDLDRDINAAANLLTLAASGAESHNASRGTVRPGPAGHVPVKEEPGTATAGQTGTASGQPLAAGQELTHAH